MLECLTAQIHYIDASDEAAWVPIADRAMALAETLGERGAQGRIYHIRADRDFTKGEYASAVRNLEQAVTNLRAAGAPEEMSLSRALTSLGRARRAHGLPERALDAYTEAMAVQKKTGDRFGVVQTWNAMGVAWSNMERPGKALECYRNGLAEAVALGDQSAVQFMEGAVATALLRSGKAADAIPIFEGILAKNPEPYIARFRLAALADAYLDVGRPADALTTIDKALALDQASHPDAVATFQFTRARANAALGRQDAAIADARTTLETYERIRQSLLPLDFVKRGYSDLIQGIFDFTVGALEEAGRHAEAVESAEAARGRALADLMASRSSVSSDGAPAVASNRDAATMLTGAGGADAAPPGLDSPVATRALSSKELSALAAAHHTTMVSYWVGADRSLVWVIRGDGTVFSATLPVTRVRLQQLVDQASTSADDCHRRRRNQGRPGGTGAAAAVRHAHRSHRRAAAGQGRAADDRPARPTLQPLVCGVAQSRWPLSGRAVRAARGAVGRGAGAWRVASHEPRDRMAARRRSATAARRRDRDCRRCPAPSGRSRRRRPWRPPGPCTGLPGPQPPNTRFVPRWPTRAWCMSPPMRSCPKTTSRAPSWHLAAIAPPRRPATPMDASPPSRSTTCRSAPTWSC